MIFSQFPDRVMYLTNRNARREMIFENAFAVDNENVRITFVPSTNWNRLNRHVTFENSSVQSRQWMWKYRSTDQFPYQYDFHFIYIHIIIFVLLLVGNSSSVQWLLYIACACDWFPLMNLDLFNGNVWWFLFLFLEMPAIFKNLRLEVLQLWDFIDMCKLREMVKIRRTVWCCILNVLSIRKWRRKRNENNLNPNDWFKYVAYTLTKMYLD